MKLHILTIVDLDNVGYTPKDVEVFHSREELNKRMTELYLNACEKRGIEEPFNTDETIDYGYCEYSYAYIFGYCYFDAFVKEVSVEEDENLIDRYGNPYVADESFPAGGGLDKRCTHNGDALYCYYGLTKRPRIYEYLKSLGWDDPIHSDSSLEIWEKGDTKIYFEDYRDGTWGYLHTEYVGE